MGASVIKIEDPIRGDSLRGLRTLQSTDVRLPEGRNVSFETASRSKRSITLNLGDDKGREVFYQLADKADIVYTNYREAVLKKLGIDYDTIHQRSPALVYGLITLYGTKGPLGERRGYDFNAQARSGVMWAIGDRDIKEPMFIYGSICDRSTGVTLALGLLAALNAKNRDGVGQKVAVSLYGSMVYIQGTGINGTSLRKRTWARHSRTRVREPLTNFYKCADDKWIVLGELRGDEFWPMLAKALGLQNEIDDPGYSTVDGRRKNFVDVIKTLDSAFIKKSQQEWLDIFHDEGLDTAGLAYSPVFNYFDVLEDKQALENNYIVPYDHPSMGEVKLIGYPIDFSETPSSISGPAPAHGQNTEEVLIEELGMGWDEIVQLKDGGII
jgi:crotonobetainyl-CoA:carnitine CoA-transferase CaiB-like acyl-CoA transferase